MDMTTITPEMLTNGGGLAIAAYAVMQLAKLVASVTLFLGKLDKSWEEEAKHRAGELEHRAAEKRHWDTEESNAHMLQRLLEREKISA